MMKHILLLVIFAAGPLAAQDVMYSVDIRNIETRSVSVTVDIKNNRASTLTYQMPAWSPGAYAMTNYGRYVEDFSAFDTKGKPLAVTRLNENRWSVKNARSISKITYRVRDSHKDTTSLYFGMAHFDTMIFFANAPALFGYVNDRKDRSTTVNYYVPLPWTLHCALDGYMNDAVKNNTVQYVFTAKDYDELVDAPVLASPKMQVRTFTESGKPVVIALTSDKTFEMDSLEDLTKKIVRAHTSFWGDFPCPRYYFLIYAPTFLRLPSMSQGALEHTNSSQYLLVNMPWERVKSSFAHIISHEIFHLWNVKRIRSSLLGPFNYTKPVKTTSLWLSEGITDYYGHLLLSRYGIHEESDFENQILNWKFSMKYSKNASKYSLEQLSLMQSDFQIENATIFYSKGPIVGLMLDIEIRLRTGGKYSLDDVMYSLYKDAKAGRHFRDRELFTKIEISVGVKMQDFYRKYIAGTDSINIDDYLAKLGLKRNASDTVYAGIGLGAKFHYTSIDKCVIDTVTAQALISAGLSKGDTILSINNEQVNREYIKKFTQKMSPPLTADILIGTPSGRRTVPHTFTKPGSTTITTVQIRRISKDPQQVELRRMLYGRRSIVN